MIEAESDENFKSDWIRTKIKYDYCHANMISTSNATGQQFETVTTMSCLNGYNYTTNKLQSLVTEWDLVCDKQSLGRFVQSVFTIGTGVGSILCTNIADRWGRRYVLIACTIGTTCSEMGLYFASNVFIAFAMRFVSGVGCGGLILIMLVITAELMVSQYRQTVCSLWGVLWALNLMGLSGVAYFLTDRGWRSIQLATVIASVPSVVASFLLNETPAWYFARGRYQEAQRVLKKASKMNGKDFITVQDIFLCNVNHVHSEKTDQLAKQIDKVESTATYNIVDIFRHSRLFLITAITCLAWFSTSLSYYGLFLTPSPVAGDYILNFFLMSVLEIPACFLYMIALIYCGRRSVVLVLLAVSAVCLFVSTVLVALEVDSIHAFNTSAAAYHVGKAAISSCFNILLPYTTELYPTTLRSTGSGICSFFARVGGVLAPFLLTIFKIVTWGPGTIITSLCVICLCLVPFLPETKGRQLPTTIEESISKGKDVKDGGTSVKKKSGVALQKL